MSRENVEVVRAFIEAYRQGQTGAALELLDEHAVLDVTRLNPPERGIAFGQEAITQPVVAT